MSGKIVANCKHFPKKMRNRSISLIEAYSVLSGFQTVLPFLLEKSPKSAEKLDVLQDVQNRLSRFTS